MPLSAEDMRDQILTAAGFLEEDGTLTPGLIDHNKAESDLDLYLRHGSLLRSLNHSAAQTDLVYETPGAGGTPARPCAYFTTLSDPSPESIARLRKQLWNHGRIPTLWVFTEHDVQIFNAFARPNTEELDDVTTHLIERLTSIDQTLSTIQLVSRHAFDEGRFWTSGPGKKIDPSQRVDYSLLRDLKDTAALLHEYDLPFSQAHTLLRQIIFVKYLEDRDNAITNDHTYRHRQPAIGAALESTESLMALLSALRNTFNGDLFANLESTLLGVTSEHLDILQRFLAGHQMRGYPYTQASLWPYTFDVIPIELISSIYEMFAHTTRPEDARAESVHYTRLSVVELMLSLSFPDLPPTARVLDPACGSGVFLVEVFRRLVRRRSLEQTQPLTREDLYDILRTQIFGIDIDPEAVSIASFSLQLALLEMDPEPDRERPMRFPRLMATYSGGISGNLLAADFFDTTHPFNQARPFASRDFDLIISNPPWTAWKDETSVEQGVAEVSQRHWGLEYVQAHGVPDKKPDQAFLHRAREFAGPHSQIAMVVGSRLLHQSSSTARPWTEAFFQNNTVECIVDLSDLARSSVLFGYESSPHLSATIIAFKKGSPDSESIFRYMAPKRYQALDKRDEIVLTSADIRLQPQNADMHETYYWNVMLRGTPRDMGLLSRLRMHPTLDSLLTSMNIRGPRDRARGVTFGKQEQKSALHLGGVPFLPGDFPRQRFSLDAEQLPLFSRRTIAARSNTSARQLPALILSRSLLNGRPVASLARSTEEHSSLVLSQSYYGISFPQELDWLAVRLNVLLNSDLVFYWCFMNGVELSRGWRMVEVGDWLRVPVPNRVLDPEDGPWNAVELWYRDRSERLDAGQSDPIMPAEINDAIFELYGSRMQDATLARDTMKYAIVPYLAGDATIGQRHVTSDDMANYAGTVCRQLNDILRHEGVELESMSVSTTGVAPLRACYFRARPSGARLHHIEVEVDSINSLLDRIASNLRQQVANEMFVARDLRAYEPEGFWIIKPDEIRLWSGAAALNDADSVVSEHLGEVLR